MSSIQEEFRDLLETPWAHDNQPTSPESVKVVEVCTILCLKRLGLDSIPLARERCNNPITSLCLLLHQQELQENPLGGRAKQAEGSIHLVSPHVSSPLPCTWLTLRLSLSTVGGTELLSPM